jgi:hypothetical protein
VLIAGDPKLAGRGGEHEGNDGSDNAVVESTLDIEDPAYPHGDAAVIDHLDARGSVGRRQCRTDKAGQSPREVVEEPGRKERAQDD